MKSFNTSRVASQTSGASQKIHSIIFNFRIKIVKNKWRIHKNAHEQIADLKHV